MSEPRMPMDQHGATLALGEKLHGHIEVTSVRFPIGICNGCGGRVVNVETGEGHGSHEWRQEAAATSSLDVRRGAAWAVHFAVKHLLSHRTDDPDLSLAIELMKAIRDEPDFLATLFERWELDPDAALTPEGGSDG